MVTIQWGHTVTSLNLWQLMKKRRKHQDKVKVYHLLHRFNENVTRILYGR